MSDRATPVTPSGNRRKPRRFGIGRCIAAAALSSMITACASVRTVMVTPSTACPGDSVTVSWDASGRTEIAAIPLSTPNAQAGPIDFCVDALASGATFIPEPHRGSLVQRASKDTLYFVEARGWFGQPAHRCGRLFVNRTLPLAAVPECVAGTHNAPTRRVLVHLSRPPNSRWSASATTGTVGNLNAVPITVEHAGRTVTLQPHGTTNAFDGTDPNTDWSVEYAWSGGPFCGHVGAPVPNSLALEIHPQCPSRGSARP
jgi:hypothetical protein